jgi:hypothetical protein
VKDCQDFEDKMKTWFQFAFLIAFSMLVLSCPTGVSDVDDTKNVPDLVVYPVPEGTPAETVVFSVKADGNKVGVYSDTNAWGNPVNFAYFHIKDGRKTKIEVETNFNFSACKILPIGLGIQGTKSGRRITFDVSKAGINISLVFDDNYTGAVIHVFVSAVDPNQPKESSGNIIYFGPGYYNLYETHNGQLNVTGTNKTVYIAPGAVVDGTIYFYNAYNCKITGGGVLMMSDLNPNIYSRIPLVFINSSNCSIGNIIANSRAIPLDGADKPRRGSWTTAINSCSNMTIDGYRVVSPTYASTDSLDFQGGVSSMTGISVKNCFLRACDDTISIKGSGNVDDSNNWQPIENFTVSDTILWSDANNAMVLGEESAAKYYKNITFSNIDVIFSYDDKTHHLDLDERSVMSIVCLDGTYFSNITWDNIRVNNCQRLICMTFLDGFWFGSVQGHQQHPGGISGVTFSNITSASPDSSSTITNEIRLSGYAPKDLNPEKYIEDITLDNVIINGTKVTGSYHRLKKNGYVRNLIFK